MPPLDPATLATPVSGVSIGVSPSAEALFGAVLDLAATLDAAELDPKLLHAAADLLGADNTSLWMLHQGELVCVAAVGEGADALAGQRVEPNGVSGPFEGVDTVAVAAAPLARGDGSAGAVRVSRDMAAKGPFSAAERVALERLAAVAGVALRNAAAVAENDRARDLALVMEMSREIASTLDLDRVLRSVVNLAMKAIPFDRGAVALYERGKCDIRAVAGSEAVDPDDPELQDLAVRAAWAAGIGESFYLSDRTEAASDAERTFLQIFGDDLAEDGVASGLYIPLKDDEGVTGILVFESARPEFATPRQQELATILANQATVALRNAQLYHQVPLADALGALHARKEAFLALPRRRRLVWAAAILAAVAGLTLIRWPLRVVGHAPTFVPARRAEIRPLVDGVVERVFVAEGARVERGGPLVQLRDVELRAERDAGAAGALAADRSAALAAARGDAAEERLHRLRADVLRREVAVLDEQVRSSLVRSPTTGVVLTPRPEELVGAWAEAGAALLVVGRTDSLELEFGVDQRDVGRLRVGDELRLRVDAFPQRTFAGRVTLIASLATDTAGAVRYPVRALVPNESGLLRPGMGAHARVLTDPASVLGRLVREPGRKLRLLWWRMWS